MRTVWNLARWVFIIYVVVIMISSCSNSSSSNNFDWNNQDDVNGFIDWKEDNGSGWSDN